VRLNTIVSAALFLELQLDLVIQYYQSAESCTERNGGRMEDQPAVKSPSRDATNKHGFSVLKA
jgi:hypothetical protein